MGFSIYEIIICQQRQGTQLRFLNDLLYRLRLSTSEINFNTHTSTKIKIHTLFTLLINNNHFFSCFLWIQRLASLVLNLCNFWLSPDVIIWGNQQFDSWVLLNLYFEIFPKTKVISFTYTCKLISGQSLTANYFLTLSALDCFYRH